MQFVLGIVEERVSIIPNALYYSRLSSCDRHENKAVDWARLRVIINIIVAKGFTMKNPVMKANVAGLEKTFTID